jgi:predicted nuclease with TOPRIM domain
MLQEHLVQSRSKVRAHHNELKELDELVKKRNKIRLLKMKEEAENKRSTMNEVLKQISSPKKELSRTFY